MKQSSFSACLPLFLAIISGCDSNTSATLKTEIVRVDSLEQIVPVTNALVKPMLYTHVAGLDQLPSEEAKAKFIAAVLPSILVAKYTINERKEQLLALHKKKSWSNKDSAFYLDMKTRYKAKDLEDMLARIGTLPNSIVLAQAAMESGWGQSRFFLQGNNLFGMWSYNRHEPRIEAGRTRGNKKIYLRSYMDISQSVTHYFEIISKSWAYRSLRKARQETTDPFVLLPHLKNFSEQRNAYTQQLRKVIEKNDLTRYDLYQIDPEYIVVEKDSRF